MKRLFSLLLICLLLAGCGEAPNPDSALPTPSLPTPVEPTVPPTQEVEKSPASAVTDFYLTLSKPGNTFSALSARLGDNVLLRSENCVIWQSFTTSGGIADPMPICVQAALTDDGDKITGKITWWRNEIGWTCTAEGIKPLESVDLSSLDGLSAEALQLRFGSCHFVRGSAQSYPSWFTREGLLISGSAYSGVTVNDLLSSSNSVWVHSSANVENLPLWNAFVESTARGEPGMVHLQFDIISEVRGMTGVQLPEYEEKHLRYDGKVYTLYENEGHTVSSYPYLIVDDTSLFSIYPNNTLFLHLVPSEEEVTDSTTEQITDTVVLFARGTAYLLSDDPDMTCERYQNHLLSDMRDPSFPDTVVLFSVRQTDAPAP